MSLAVRLSGLSKAFHTRDGNAVAADRIGLDILRGESVGVIGPNGAGKTTLLRLVAGILQPDGGRIERVARTVALVDLGAGFHPDLTGDENIYFACSLHGLRRRQIDAKRASIHEFADIGDAINKEVRHYSDGMVARLAFSVAAHTEPDLLMIDEVLAVGDVGFQRRCLQTLRQMHRQGVTLIVVSHDLSAIADLCDRVVLIEKGVITRDGTPSSVIAHYLGSPLDSATDSLRVHISLPEGPVDPAHLVVRVTGTATRRHPDASAWIQIGLPVHPAANVVEGLDGPLIVAETPAGGAWSEKGAFDREYVLMAPGLPPGRFVARVLIRVPGEEPVHTSSEFVVEGDRPVHSEIRLRSSATIAVAELDAS